MPESFSKEELQHRISWYIKLRWFIIAGLGSTGIIPQFLQESFSSQVVQNFELVAVALAANTVFLVINSINSTRIGVYRLLAVAQLTFDVIVMTAVIYYNGGIEEANVMLYVIPIIMSGALLGPKAIYLTGVSASTLYDLLLILDYRGVVIPQNILAPTLHSNTHYLIQTLIFVPAMIMTITVVVDFVGKLIRERTQLSAHLQQVSAQKAETEAILETLGSAITVIDTAGIITMVNDAFERLTGWTKEEVTGVGLDKILPLLDENGHKIIETQRPILKILHNAEDGARQEVEHISRFYYARKNGTIFPFLASLAPIVVNGRVTGATTVFEDITTTKQMQQLKSNFVALASHQLKTPLAEIRGYAENLLSGIVGTINGKQAQYLQSIDEIAFRCTRMIGNLLDINILEQGNIRLNLQPIRLKSVIDEVLKIHQNRIRQKRLRVNIIEERPDMEVLADSDKLIEVVANVVDNAVNYTRLSSAITITTKPSAGSGLILVTDQGEGIDAKSVNEIFQRDNELLPVPTAKGGTGLGFYLAKGLLKLQNGEISVLSSSREGTTIAIKIPLGSRPNESS